MATTNQFNRGYVKTISFKLKKGNNGAANAITAKLPQGALLVDSDAVSVTPFDGTGTVTATLTDGTTAFVSAVNVKDAAGVETVAVASKAFPSGGVLQAYISDANGDSTIGEVWLTASYIETNGSNEVYG